MSDEIEVQSIRPYRDIDEDRAEEFYNASEWRQWRLTYGEHEAGYKQFRVGCNGLWVLLKDDSFVVSTKSEIVWTSALEEKNDVDNEERVGDDEPME